MKFKHLPADGFTDVSNGKPENDGYAQIVLLRDIRELLRILVNEARMQRAMDLGLNDADDMPEGEGGKQ